MFFTKLFVPSNDSDVTSVALLVARLWFGLTMLFNHGFDKLANFHDKVAEFPDPLGLGHDVTLVLVIFAEVVAALMLTVGLCTRLAALVLVVDMFVAFLMVNKTVLNGQGELAFLYLAGYVILLIAGGGLFSLDTVAFARAGRGRTPQKD